MTDRLQWIKERLFVIRGDIDRLNAEASVLIREQLQLGVEAMRIDASHVNIVYVSKDGITKLPDCPIDAAIKELHMRASYIDSVHSDVWFEGDTGAKHMVFKGGDCRMFLEEYKS